MENKVLLGDCFAVMETLPSASVDCVFADLPYGTTRNKWDTVLPMERLWAAWKRLLRPGAPVILFTQQPFTTVAAASNLKQLRTEWVWEKNIPTGFLNANRYPLKRHENVLVFCDRMPRYTPQKVSGGVPWKTRGTATPRTSSNWDGFRAQASGSPDGSRYPTSILRFARETGLHPTQKPVALCEYLLRTYTQPGQTVLDPTAGSGTTLVAAANLNRRFIGIEQDPAYHATILRRLADRVAASVQHAIAASE